MYNSDDQADNSVGSSSTGNLADVTSLLDGDGFGAGSISVREHPSGGWGMHPLHSLSAVETVKNETGLSTASTLDLAAVLIIYSTVHAVLESVSLARIIFWIALVAIIEARMADGTRLGERAGGGRDT